MSPDRPHRIRVLIVDDDARVRAGLRQMLSSTGEFEVGAVAATAPEAYRALATGHPYDIAIVDVRLPTERLGLALIRDLAADLPVLALSINGTGRHDALAAGARAYLEKDGVPDALLTAIRSLVSRPA